MKTYKMYEQKFDVNVAIPTKKTTRYLSGSYPVFGKDNSISPLYVVKETVSRYPIVSLQKYKELKILRKKYKTKTWWLKRLDKELEKIEEE